MSEFSPCRWLRVSKYRSAKWNVVLVLVATMWPLAKTAVGQSNSLRKHSKIGPAVQEENASFSDWSGSLVGQSPPGLIYDANVSQAGASYRGARRRVGTIQSNLFPGSGAGVEILTEGVTVEELAGEVVGEGELIEGPLYEHGEDCIGCSDGCLIPCPGNWLERVEFFAGVQGFTGPANRGGMGSFGFYEGVNWGAPVGCMPWEIGAQIGARWTQSQFGGASFSASQRNQVFVTGGLFRRADWGLQGGVVIDYLYDEWYFENELVQVRGEVSWMSPCAHEIGLWFTANARDSVSMSNLPGVPLVVEEEWETTDLYAFFYRHHFEDCGATGRLFVGFSGGSDALLGAAADVPVSERWALRAGFTYLIPEEASPGAGFLEESWNVSTGLVFYPGCRTARNRDYNHPLFNVADNGSMPFDRK